MFKVSGVDITEYRVVELKGERYAFAVGKAINLLLLEILTCYDEKIREECGPPDELTEALYGMWQPPTLSMFLEFDHKGNVQDRPENWLDFGSFWGTGALSYATTPNAAIRSACKRMWGLRTADSPSREGLPSLETVGDYHFGLFKNQRDAVIDKSIFEISYTANEKAYVTTENTYTQAYKLFTNWYVRECEKTPDFVDAFITWLDGSKKKELNTSVAQKCIRKGLRLRDNRNYIDYKAKPGELLAPGKQLRSIGEISKESALEHGPLAEKHKYAFTTPYVYRGCAAVFCPGPRLEYLVEAVKFLDEALGIYKYVVIFFSDDHIAGYNSGGLRIMWNGDISAADASIATPIFQHMIDTISKVDAHLASRVKTAFAQAGKPVRVVNTSYKMNKKTKKAREYVNVPLRGNPPAQIAREMRELLYNYILPSGHSGTTLANNWLEMVGFIAVVDKLARRSPRTLEDLTTRVEKGWASAGAKVKIIIASDFTDLQFLKFTWNNKNSPESPLMPWHGFGGWFKKWGLLHNSKQLPSWKENGSPVSLERRLEAFVSEMVYSRKSWGNSHLYRAFSEAFPEAWRNKSVAAYYEKNLHNVYAWEQHVSEDMIAIVPIESVVARYKCSAEEYLDCCELIRQLKIGDHLEHPFINRVMEKDEGFASVGYAAQNQKEYPTFTILDNKLVTVSGVTLKSQAKSSTKRMVRK